MEIFLDNKMQAHKNAGAVCPGVLSVQLMSACAGRFSLPSAFFSI